MRNFSFSKVQLGVALVVLSSFLASCTTQQANSKYFGRTSAPEGQVMRYVSGSEPESLDPQVPTGQPEARVLMAFYDGLVEYDPKTMEPIPALATSWEPSKDGTEYTFNLRKGATFSNGDPLTAKDIAYTFRRGLSPELAAQNAYLAYYIKYGEAYNSGKMFVKNTDGNFVMVSDLVDKAEVENSAPEKSATRTLEPDVPVEEPLTTEKIADADAPPETEFHKYINEPERLSVAGSPLNLALEIKGNDKLKPYFLFKDSGFKDAAGFVKKIQTDQSPVSKYLQQKLGADVISACADAANCNDAAKQKLADSLNKLVETDNLFQPEIITAKTAPYNSKTQKLLESIDKKNEEINKANAKLDEEIAKAETAEAKEKKLKEKKTNIGQLFYVNRFMMEDLYGDYLQASPIVAIEGKDIGVEAVDDYTFRMKMIQPAPFFIGLLGHQFFRIVHQGTIEKFGTAWTQPKNIVTSGAFKLTVHNPYDEIIAVKNPTYWDAENVRLDRIEFYPLEEQTTMMNLYKAGNIDATYNHTVPAGWKENVKQYKEEYLNFPEVSIEYYTIAVNRPPMDNVKIRRAFSNAVNRGSLITFRKSLSKPLINFTPDGAFPKYEEVRDRVYAELLKKDGITIEDWKSSAFNAKRACDLFEESGYKIRERKDDGRCIIETDPAVKGAFPADKVEILYNTSESNKAVAEFIQSQWKQNLGITAPLKNQEWKTFLKVRKEVDYNGFGRAGWVGDYIDPFTFLNLFYGKTNDSSTGWYNPEYDKMLDAANQELDPIKRFEKLAEAEYFVMKDQPVIPFLTAETNWIKKPYVKGFYPNPGTLHPWKFVYIEHDPAKWDTQVENIMKNKDPWVEQQVSRLMKTQEDFKKSKETMKSDDAKVE